MRLRAVGTGYLHFAQAEPGLFRTAFSVPDVLQGAAVPEKAGRYLAWSAVHGLAMLVIDGPLRTLSQAQKRLVSQHLLDMVEKGLC